MPKRKYHCKSRNGCLTCKKRHIKCDETGPPCANCLARDTHCTYEPPPQSDEGRLPAQADDMTSSSGRRPPSPSPHGRRINALELRLMNRWSTSTYLSFCSISEEHPLLQTLLPKYALRYGFLMDGILSLAALDLAVTSPESAEAISPAEYSHAAARYYDSAISSYRALVEKVTRESLNQEFFLALLCFSLMIGAFNLAMPQTYPGGDLAAPGKLALESIIIHFDLIYGSGEIAKMGWDFVKTGPIPPKFSMDEWEARVPHHLVDAGTKAALARLRSLNDIINASGACVDGMTSTGPILTLPGSPSSAPLDNKAMYAKAISSLEEYFARGYDTEVKGIAIIWPTIAGQEYAAAVRRSEPMAMFVLMCFGVLLDRAGKDYWWANRAGKNLVDEISRSLRQSTFASLDEWREGLVWCRQQVGLSGEDAVGGGCGYS